AALVRRSSTGTSPVVPSAGVLDEVPSMTSPPTPIVTALILNRYTCAPTRPPIPAPGSSVTLRPRLSASCCASLGNTGTTPCTSTTKCGRGGGGPCARAAPETSSTAAATAIATRRMRESGLYNDRHDDEDAVGHVRAHAAGRGEDAAADRGVPVPDRRPAHRRQARNGAAQSLRPRGAPYAVEHGPERDHRRRTR